MVLSEARRLADLLLRRWFAPDNVTVDSQLLFVVGYMRMAAAGSWQYSSSKAARWRRVPGAGLGQQNHRQGVPYVSVQHVYGDAVFQQRAQQAL
ncbi:hypothetical protein HK405_010402 [Cladochytrium tenue]|nr:hypothetical protein HK405_010402 [Cladochytrium tenue]